MFARIVAVLMVVGLAGCGGGGGGTTSANPPALTATLQTIAVAPASLSLGIGASQAYTATGNYSDGTTQDLTSSASWTSSATSIASISASGVVSAIAIGSSTISATANGVTGSAPLTVTAVTLQSIAITPATLTLGTGAIQGYTATGTYSDNSTQDITASAAWTSSVPTVATVGANTGVVTAVAAGTTTLTATASGKSASVTITVTSAVTKSIASIAVTPAAVSLATGATQQLTATATYTDASTADVTSSATWLSASSGVAAVSSSGLVTAGTTTGNGVAVTASIGGATGTSTVSVTSAAVTLTGISIPVAQTIYTGQSWDPSTWADAAFSNGTGQHPYAFVSWSVSACSPANAASVDANGWIAANAAGTCTLTATSGTLTATSTLTIAVPTLSSIAVIPANPVVGIGTTLQLAAIGTFNDGSTQDITNSVNWTSLSTGVATVSATGLVTGVALGSATITAQKSVTIGLTLYSRVGSAIVSVPATATTSGSVTVPAASIIDNTIVFSSLNSSKQKTTYSVNAWSNNSLGVGCNWYLMYDPIAQMNIQNLECAEALVFFDVAATIPAGKTIVSATLTLETNTYGVGTVPRPWHYYALANAYWNGNSVTWDSASSFQYYSASLKSNIAPPTYPYQTYSFDVTNIVRNWYSGAWTNSGLELGIDNVLFPYAISLDAFQFFSSEDPSGRGPKLVVNYQ